MNWNEFEGLGQKKLNLGGGGDCHPVKHYENYVAVDLETSAEFGISHDLTKPIPIQSDSVDTVLSEHFFEHIPAQYGVLLVNECLRILKPGGNLRIAVPDYGSPKNKKAFLNKFDPKHTDHVEFPTYDWVKKLAASSEAKNYSISNYWQGSMFHFCPTDYSLGWVKRTVENDKRNYRNILMDKFFGIFRDIAMWVSCGFPLKGDQIHNARGRKYRMTSIILDITKE